MYTSCSTYLVFIFYKMNENIHHENVAGLTSCIDICLYISKSTFIIFYTACENFGWFE